MSDANSLVYLEPDVVSCYVGMSTLQAAEARILD